MPWFLKILATDHGQGRTGHCGNAAIAARLFFENARLFSRMRGILNTFSEKVWGFYKNYEAFWRHFQRNGDFFIDYKACKKPFQWNWAFFWGDVRLLERIRGFFNLFPDKLRFLH
jgi:hypothetical protein